MEVQASKDLVFLFFFCYSFKLFVTLSQFCNVSFMYSLLVFSDKQQPSLKTDLPLNPLVAMFDGPLGLRLCSQCHSGFHIISDIYRLVISTILQFDTGFFSWIFLAWFCFKDMTN